MYPQEPTDQTTTTRDLPHETPNVLQQIGDKNAYFVMSYECVYPQSTADERQQVMNYLPLGGLPALHTLARNFLICDAWHSSVPGPTWTNRFFAQSGTSLGRVNMPAGIFHTDLHWYNQDTLYDRLNERGLSWNIYAGDFPQSLLFTHQLLPRNAARYLKLDRFREDVARSSDKFPAFAFIEPHYFFEDENDDHPPSDLLAGERLLAEVYNGLRANTPLWNSTLMIVLFDEHGGFYDHVDPPATIAPDDYATEYTFDRLGVRVPAVLVSPWVEAGVFHSRMDHTSLLRYLSDKWDLLALGRRAAVAESFADAIGTTGSPRPDTPQRIDVTSPATRGATSIPVSPLNGHQRALIAFSEYLESQTEGNLAQKVERSFRMMESEESSAAVAIQRVDRFLEQQRRPETARRTFTRRVAGSAGH
jgi:phospholipase C